MKNSLYFFTIIFYIWIPPIYSEEKSILIYDILKEKNVYTKNINKELIPASTIKILTSLVAIEKLGLNYRFKTEAYIDNKKNLYIKGFGDPLFISDEIKKFSKALKKKLSDITINNIIVDQTFFKPQSIYFQGTDKYSLQPYDAPNNALAANFNSVCFIKKNKHFFSCEKETPLLKEVVPVIKKTGLSSGRIPVSGKTKFHLLYFGYLVKYFLTAENIKINGKVKIFNNQKYLKKKIMEYHSSYTLKDIIEKMLFYSNNFCANQLFLRCGVKNLHYIATTEKSISFFKNYLKKKNIKAKIFEGSGISRKNKISASEMLKILKSFKKYSYLLKNKGQNFYKTGTLNNIKNLCGYYKKGDKNFIYIIFLNKSTKNPFNEFKKIFDELK